MAGAVSDLLLEVESVEVRAEMVRLHELHSILGLALRNSIKRANPDMPWDKVDAEAVRAIQEATAELLGG
jgi:hypothetical protein